MTLQKNIISVLIVSVFILASCKEQTDKNKSVTENGKNHSDPLPSWKNGPLKDSIISYVKSVTENGGKNFVPIDHRIATFDNDGTLWAEKPYVQELFAFFMTKKITEKHPELAKIQPFKAVVEKDKEYFIKGGEKALIELITATHAGVTEQEFENSVHEFLNSATYPGKNVPISEITYKPQIELLNYLRANNFRTFICTGGTIGFVREVSEKYYGVPKSQVIGTSFQYEFIDSNRVIYRKPVIGSFNDKSEKPANIQLHIGEPPIFACGNEGGAGDIAMLEFCQSNQYPSFQLLINHNDSIREFYYQEKDSASLTAAKKNKWYVVSMKDDWNVVFTK